MRPQGLAPTRAAFHAECLAVVLSANACTPGMLRLETRRSPCVMPARAAFLLALLSSMHAAACGRNLGAQGFLLWLHFKACGHLSFPTRDGTLGPSSEGAESQSRPSRGSPSCVSSFKASLTPVPMGYSHRYPCVRLIT